MVTDDTESSIAIGHAILASFARAKIQIANHYRVPAGASYEEVENVMTQIKREARGIFNVHVLWTKLT